MKNNPKKVFTMVVAFAMALAFAMAGTNTIVMAADSTVYWNPGTPPAVSDGDTVIIADGASGTLSVGSGITVYIVGNAVLSSGITLEMDTDTTVYWKANVHSNINDSPVVSIAQQTSWGNFTMLAGEIISTGNNSPGIVGTGVGGADITINGLVSTSGNNSHAVSGVGGGNVNVNNSGRILASGSGSFGIWASGNVNINGGIVVATGATTARGGSGGNSITVTEDGAVFGIGANINDIMGGQGSPFDTGRITGSGMVAWMNALPTGTFTAGQAVAGLYSYPAGAEGIWDIQNGIGGIQIISGVFIPLRGVNILSPTVIFSPTSAAINDSNLSQIVNVQGTAIGYIEVNHIIPPALQPYITVEWTENPTITITGTRPTTDVQPIVGSFNIYVGRSDVKESFEVDVNLTTTWEQLTEITPDTEQTPGPAVAHDVAHDVPQTGITGRMLLPLALSVVGAVLIVGALILRRLLGHKDGATTF